MNKLSPTQFLVCLLLFGLVSLASYVFFVDWAIYNNIATRRFFDNKYMVAEHLKEQPKIIINSGSTGRYAIDSPRLEVHFAVPVLNLALNGNKSFDHLVQEIDRFATTGDTVLLPLEWPFYSREVDFDQNYISAISLGHYLNHYYQDANWYERIRYALKFPPHILLRFGSWSSHLLQKEDALTPRYLDELSGMLRGWQAPPDKHGEVLFKSHNINGDRKHSQKIPQPKPAIMNCSKIFRNKYQVAANFKYGLRRLRKVANDKQLQVFFIPPATLSKSCEELQSVEAKQHIVEYFVNIKKTLTDYDFTFLGDTSIADFDFTYRADINPFHINHVAKKIYTSRLISLLETAQLELPITAGKQTVAQLVLPGLYEDLVNLRAALLKRIEPWSGQTLAITQEAYRRSFLIETPFMTSLNFRSVEGVEIIALWYKISDSLPEQHQGVIEIQTFLPFKGSAYINNQFIAQIQVERGESFHLPVNYSQLGIGQSKLDEYDVTDNDLRLFLIELRADISDANTDENKAPSHTKKTEHTKDQRILVFIKSISSTSHEN